MMENILKEINFLANSKGTNAFIRGKLSELYRAVLAQGAENVRLRVAWRINTLRDHPELSHEYIDAQIERIARGGALEQSALTPVPPHEFFPSTAHLGDCGVCGHDQDDDAHKQRGGTK